MKHTSMIARFASGWLAMIGAVGCGPPPIGPPPGPPPGAKGQPLKREPSPFVAMPLHRPAEGDREALTDVVRANNAFALDLYHRVRREPGNLLVSPTCLTVGLAMLRAGARGETAAEIDRALHRSDRLADAGLAALMRDLNDDGSDLSFQIRLADAVWFQEGYPILDAYRRTLHDVFALGDERRVDFNGHPDQAAASINDWVSERTGGKIAGAIAPEAVRPPTKMVLTSAFYFRGNWSEQFHEEATHDAGFDVSWYRTVTVPMMYQHSYIKGHGYADLGSYRVVTLPCGHGAYSMAVFLPKTVAGLAEMEAALTPDTIDAIWPGLKFPEEIIISLPKFRLRASRALTPALQALGVSRAFDPGRADFSGINGKTNDLFVATAMHDTLIDVNERGIEAAAATEIISVDAFGEEPPVVTIDHPFFYLIRDNRSGCIVFMGRVVNPLASF
jgi:serpin B